MAEPVSPRPVDHAKSTTSMGDVFLAVTGAGWEPPHPSVSLAGSEEQMNFSRQSPKMFKIASDIFIHAFFVVVFRSFSQNFPFGVPVACAQTKLNSSYRLHAG